jgi:hypothetical protein
MNPSARLFHCARCHRQVIICRQCDRGNVYCAEGCADLARCDSLRRASRRYRATRRGRHTNAARQRRFRAREREKVTHQGSPQRLGLVLLRRAGDAPQIHREVARHRPRTAIYCHLCQRDCDPFLRVNFLRPP